MRGAAASGILAVRKRAAPRNRMREILTSGSVGGLAEQSLVLPGRIFAFLTGRRPLFTVAWGNAPGIRATRIRLAEGHIHVKTVRDVRMAFGQKCLVFHVPGALPCRLYTSRFGRRPCFHRSLGQAQRRPRTRRRILAFGRRPYSRVLSDHRVIMAYSQKYFGTPDPWALPKATVK